MLMPRHTHEKGDGRVHGGLGILAVSLSLLEVSEELTRNACRLGIKYKSKDSSLYL